MIENLLLAAGAFGAAFYCFLLSRRLRRFTDLETGVGGAVAVLSAQVDDLSKTLVAARTAAEDSVSELARATAEANQAVKRMELMLAALHDIPKSQDLTPEFTRTPRPRMERVR